MGLTLSADDRGVKVYRHDKVSAAGNPYTMYSLAVSSKGSDGNWNQGYMDCAFKKGVSVNNKSVIRIKNAFPTVNSYNGKSTVRWMITDFDVISDGEAPAPAQSPVSGFMDIPDGIDEELPFE